MSDEESAPCFLNDDRVKFVEEKVCGLLRLNRQIWEKSSVSEEFQTILKEFFEKKAVLFFCLSDKGFLVASNEVWFLLTLQQYVSFHKVCAPLLSNNENHHMWPNLMSADIVRHVQRLCNKTSVVRGQVLGKTILPIPAATEWMEKSYSSFKMCENYDRALAHAIETQVINWTNLIQKILKEDSSDLLATGCNPGPDAELKFWASRRGNVESIYHQLHSPVVQMMTKMLEMMDSSYHPTIKTLIGNVFTALQEAQDIDLHLQPLHAQLTQMEKKGFPHMEKCIPVLFHLLFLIWTNCQSYQRPARIVVLLQELCNLLIEQASTYLSADLLLREDPEESLQMVQMVIKVFTCFKDSCQSQREKLANQVKLPPWDFPSALIFSRFNQFFNRMLQLEVRSDFGFILQGFENEYNEFKMRIVDFECRLGSLLCLVFKDCPGLESALKILTIAGPFLENKQIRQIFSSNFFLLQQHFREELENCKCLFKSQMNQMESGLSKNMAHTSGALKWAKMLRERIQTPWEKIRLLFDMSVQAYKSLFNEKCGYKK
uniref:Dynein heavy chain tail domain-containing protein n=1 Tax=Acanthochromis polyacanthus TaxID=80966 RepID=A0A3Q1GSB8_9TELE